ncbi:MAG: hypothetical protein ABIF82_01640 [Planctomycetota bacterium]
MGETEVFRLDLDTSQIEKKAARVEQLVADIKGKRAKGEDVSDLERNLNKELDGLGKLAAQEKKAAGSTEELTKQKEKLGAAVRVMGGQFSGAVGDVGGLVELLMSGQRAAIGFGGALAGLTAVISVVGYIRAEFAKLREEQEKLDESYKTLKTSFAGASDAMGDTLQRYGALNAETEKAAGNIRRQIERAGFKRETAVTVAPLAAMEQMTADEAILAAQLQAMGVALEPGQVKKTIAELQQRRPGVIAGAREQIAALGETEVGGRRRFITKAQRFGAVERTPEELTVDAMRENEIRVRTKEGVREARAGDIERAEELRLRITELQGWQAGLREEPYFAGKGLRLERLQNELAGLAVEFARLQGETILSLLQEARKLEPSGYTPPTEPPVYTQQVNILNVGTQINAPDARSRPLVGSVGVSAAAAGQHKVPLGG